MMLAAEKNPYAEDLEFGVDISRMAGAIILARFRAPGTIAQPKPDFTPVTPADKAVEKMVRVMLREHRPDDAVLSEETVPHIWGGRPGEPRRRWVFDAVDGTWLLAAGVRGSMFSIALLEDRQPVLGIVYDPHNNDMTHAVINQGSFRNGERISVNDSRTIEGGTFCLPGGRVKSLNAGALLHELIDMDGEQVTSGSAVYDAVQVATGFAAGNVFPYESPWDLAAVDLIAREARRKKNADSMGTGGRITDLRGREQFYDQPINGAIISNGLVHDALTELVGRHLANPEPTNT